MGLIVKDNGVQAVYGPKADILKSDIQDALDSGVEIPKETVTESNVDEQKASQELGATVSVVSVADGQVIGIEDVNDEVFSQKMMGEGFGVEPEAKEVVSPVSGKVTSIFPTKHAIGLLTDDGLEILVHMGLDTVQMNEIAFDVVVKEGEVISQGQLLANANWDKVQEEGKGTTIVVVFTNSHLIKEFNLTDKGLKKQAELIGEIKI